MKSLRILALSLVLLSTLVISSCEDGVIDQVTYKVTVVNNGEDDVIVFWKIEDNDFEEVGELSNGESLDVRPLAINADNVIEARLADGTVAVSESYNQSDDTDRTLVIN
jgi:hypothetical protein